MKNLLLIFLFFIVVWYAYITVSEKQQQKLIKARRANVQEMFNKYEFRRALYKIRETREKMNEEEIQDTSIAEEKETEDQTAKEEIAEDLESLEKLKSQPATPAQPLIPLGDNMRYGPSVNKEANNNQDYENNNMEVQPDQQVQIPLEQLQQMQIMQQQIQMLQKQQGIDPQQAVQDLEQQPYQQGQEQGY